MNTSIDNDAAAFITAAKSHAVPDESVVALLRGSGWSERRAVALLGSYYAQRFGLSVPRRTQSYEHAREAFYYLINFITLAFWATALGEIGYTLIAQWFPDPASSYRYAQPLVDQLSWQIAMIAVAFPIFALVHVLIGRSLAQRPEMYESGVRKWLTYIALVIASVIVITDGVWFINAFLRGELSIRFILDELLLLAISGGIFTYYLRTIEPPKADR